MSAMPKARSDLLILRAGHTAPAVIREHGDYDRWFTDRMTGLGCRYIVHHVPQNGLPDTDRYDGVLVTGTADSVLDRAPWMRALGEFLARGGSDGPPVLAVCFGAQLAAVALGGSAARNPNGWEIGTGTVDLNSSGLADPLFEGLPARIEIQSSHEDAITALPPGATLLAGNDASEVQAFAHGRRLRAVQFHPEATGGIIRTLIRIRRAGLEEDARTRLGGDPEGGRLHVDRLERSVRESEHGRRILENWVRRFVRGAGQAPGA